MHMLCHLKSKVVVASLATLATIGVLTACGGGGSASDPGGGGGGGGSVSTTIAGAIANSPLNGVSVKATCADGSSGGTGVSTFGSYSVSVTCALANYPIVIEVTGDGGMAGPDMQFATLDDSVYRLSERAPLKVAIEASTTTSANMTALSTLAAQPIADKIAAFKAAPSSAPRVTAADVFAAESKVKIALGLDATDVKRANTLTDPQVARISAQLLEAVAVVRAMNPDAGTAEQIMSGLAQAAQVGGGGGTGAAGVLVRTEDDGLKSFDMTTAKLALSNAATFASGSATGPSPAQINAVSAALSDAAAVESAVKSIGAEMEQVAKVMATLSAALSYDPTKQNLSNLASDIQAALSNPTNFAGSTAALLAQITAESMRQAGVKAQEVDASSTIAAPEKAMRKRGIFEAAEAIRSASEHEALVRSIAGPLTQDEMARAFAQVSLSVNLAADLIKTGALADLVDSTTGKPKATVDGLAEKVRGDVGLQIAAKGKAELGDLKSLNPQTVLGPVGVTSIGTGATNVANMLKDFRVPTGVADPVGRAAVVTVIGSMSGSVDTLAAKNTVLGTIALLATNLNDATSQVVTVGAASNVALSTLPADLQTKLLTLAAHTLIGPAKLDYSSAPPISTAASAINSAAYTVSRTIATTKPQAIAWGLPPAVTVGTNGQVMATGGSSGNTVTFSSSTVGVCTVVGTTVTGIGAGECTITANQAGNANYLAAPPVVQTFSVGKGNQTITFGAVPTVAVGGTGTLSASGGGSNNPIVFSSTTPSVCTVSASTVTAVSGGNCIVLANQVGNANYNDAPVATQTFGVGLNAQVIKFAAAPSLLVGGAASVSAAGGASGLPVTFNSTTLSVCTVTGAVVTGTGAGSCVIAANQAGNANYLAATQVTLTIIVGQASQTIIFGAAPSLSVGGKATVSATGGASGNLVTLSSTTPSICTIAGSTVTGVSVGNCVIAANQAGNANYSAAGQVTMAIGIGQLTQSISFGAPPVVTVGSTNTVSVTGGPSGNPVILSSLTPAVCRAAGAELIGLSAGTCSIVANQAGSAIFGPAPQASLVLQVGLGMQSIAFGAAPNMTVGTTGALSANGGPSTNPISFSTTTPSICTVTGSILTGVSVGNCAVMANQAGNADYLPATEATQIIAIGQAASNFSGVCKVQLASAIGYVTGVPTEASCNAAIFNVDGNGAQVTVSGQMPAPGNLTRAFDALTTCSLMGLPPSPGALQLIPCKK